jgi:hypothetical protein
MADIVFVRANQNAPIREGDAVTTIPSALPGTGSIYTVSPGNLPPSGQAGFAQSVLSGRFRNYAYYFHGSGDAPDNPTQPNF